MIRWPACPAPTWLCVTVALVGAVPGAAASAQDAPDRVVANVTLDGRPPLRYASLRAATVYRIEVTPATARVVFRLRARFREPPLRTFQADGQVPSDSGTYFVAPATSGQYAIELVTTDVPARVRIVIDATGTDATRVIAAHSRRPLLGMSVRVVYESAYLEYPIDHLVYLGMPVDAVASTGVEACVVAVPRGVRTIGAVGGCFATLGAYSRSYGRSYVAFGMAPRLRILGLGATGGLALTAQLRLAQASQTLSSGWLTYFGGGLMYGYPISAHSEVETGVSLLRVDGNGGLYPRPADTFLQVGLGITAHR